MNTGKNHLALADVIVDRICEQVTDFRAVMGIEEASRIRDDIPQSPLAYVAFDGAEVLPGDGRARAGASQMLNQGWIVFVAVRNFERDRRSLLNEAGHLMAAVMDALKGWTPPGYGRPFVLVTAPKPDYLTNYSLFPVKFEIQLTS